MDIKSIASDFQFIGSSVKKVQITNDFVVLPDADSLKKQIDVDYVIESLQRNDEDQDIFSTLLLSVRVTYKHNKSKMDIKFEIQGAFVAPYEMDDATFERMLSTNGCASLYSIARAIIVCMSSQVLANGCIYLPMVNIFKLNEEKQKKINTK